MAKSPYHKYPGIDAMSVQKRTKALEETCLDALSGGWRPERMQGLVESSIENEEYELAQAILAATEKFQQIAQLSGIPERADSRG
jgi:hypothetical protein